MEKRSSKQYTQDVLDVVREQLASTKVQERLGDRGPLMTIAAGMARVADIEDGRLVEFPDYENRDIFPLVMLSDGEQVLSTMTAPLPLQQEVVRTIFRRSWDKQGIDYSEADIDQLLAMWAEGTKVLKYDGKAEGIHDSHVSVHVRKDDNHAPFLVNYGRPHILLQSRRGRNIDDASSTLVHELSHAVDALKWPFVFLDADTTDADLRLARLRCELTAYATQAIVRRVHLTGFEKVRNIVCPHGSEFVEVPRRLLNGPYTSENAFEPNRKIELALGLMGLRSIYDYN